jgi:hypothetical protein
MWLRLFQAAVPIQFTGARRQPKVSSRDIPDDKPAARPSLGGA